MAAARHQVLLFLQLVKGSAQRSFNLWRRAENLHTLARLGMTVQEAKERVLQLVPEDYVSGPSPNYNAPGLDVWVFGLEVGEVEVYVKLSLVLDPEECVCLSFHVSDRPMDYPLRPRR